MEKKKLKRVKRKGKIQILVKSQKGQELNRREAADLQAGKMPYALPVDIIQKKSGMLLVYDVTNYMMLEQYVHTVMNQKKFVELMLQILEIFQKMSDSYYYPRNLVLELDKVPVNPSTGQVKFLFVPILSYDYGISIQEFLLQLIYRTTFEPSEDMGYVKQCLDIMQRNTNFSIAELQGCLYKFQKNKKHQAYMEDIEPHIIEKEYHPPLREEKKNDYPSTTDILHPDGTYTETVLFGESVARAYLKRVSTGDVYYLEKTETKIGKIACDILVTDNSTVSREHALILKKDDGYYIRDLNSKNGTKVNGEKISGKDDRLLKNNDEIKLSNEIFLFDL